MCVFIPRLCFNMHRYQLYSLNSETNRSHSYIKHKAQIVCLAFDSTSLMEQAYYVLIKFAFVGDRNIYRLIH